MVKSECGKHGVIFPIVYHLKRKVNFSLLCSSLFFQIFKVTMAGPTLIHRLTWKTSRMDFLLLLTWSWWIIRFEIDHSRIAEFVCGMDAEIDLEMF